MAKNNRVIWVGDSQRWSQTLGWRRVFVRLLFRSITSAAIRFLLRVRFDAWATCLQETTVPGWNAAHRTIDRGRLFFGQVSQFHSKRVPLRAAIKLFTSEHFWRDHSRVYASHGFTVCLSLNLCV